MTPAGPFICWAYEVLHIISKIPLLCPSQISLRYPHWLKITELSPKKRFVTTVRRHLKQAQWFSNVFSKKINFIVFTSLPGALCWTIIIPFDRLPRNSYHKILKLLKIQKCVFCLCLMKLTAYVKFNNISVDSFLMNG